VDRGGFLSAALAMKVIKAGAAVVWWWAIDTV